MKLTHLHTDYNAVPLNLCINLTGFKERWIRNHIGISSFGSIAMVVCDHEIQFFFDRDVFSFANKKIFEELHSIPIDAALEQSAYFGDKILKIYSEYANLIPHLDNGTVARLFSMILDYGSRLCCYGYLGVFPDFPDPLLSDYLEKILGENKSEVIFLTESDKKNPLKLFKEDVSKGMDYSKVKEKWGWINYGHLGPGITEGKLPSVINDDFSIKKQDLLFKELGIDKSAFLIAQDINYLKAYRADILNCIYAFYDVIYKKISKELGCEKVLVSYSTPDELLRYLSNKEMLDVALLKVRKNGSVWVSSEQGITVGCDVQGFLDEHVVKQNIEGRFKGNIAYPGKVSGVVKIVNNLDDMNKVDRGDIMVSVHTSPELLPAMEKAAGFVSEIGGITSHTAIVAREMKKPCIVGVKGITQQLKDGDMITVDADHGVVRV